MISDINECKESIDICAHCYCSNKFASFTCKWNDGSTMSCPIRLLTTTIRTLPGTSSTNSQPTSSTTPDDSRSTASSTAVLVKQTSEQPSNSHDVLLLTVVITAVLGLFLLLIILVLCKRLRRGNSLIAVLEVCIPRHCCRHEYDADDGVDDKENKGKREIEKRQDTTAIYSEVQDVLSDRRYSVAAPTNGKDSLANQERRNSLTSVEGGEPLRGELSMSAEYASIETTRTGYTAVISTGTAPSAMATEIDKRASTTPAVTVQDDVEGNAQAMVLTENEAYGFLTTPESDNGQYEVVP